LEGAAVTPGFTGSPLDRADRVRHDADTFSAAKGDRRAQLLVLDGDLPRVGDEGRLVWTSLTEAPDDAVLLFLGYDEDKPHFVAFRSDEKMPAARSPALADALDRLRTGEAATYAAARSLLAWHARNGFCANCSAATAIFRAGWGRTCAQCGAEHFPRVDPVVIMLAEHRGRVLLGRQASWPARRYSALAGFLEPGEAIEEAVRREILEETGVAVGPVRYVASQPWPFPAQLMIACIAEATHDTITIDPHELENAIWVPRGDVAAALAGVEDSSFLPPPPYAIARTLLDHWVNEA